MGIDNPGHIDVVAFDQAADLYRLVVVEDGPWDGSVVRLKRLQAKLNAYLGFALDGRMSELYPGAEGKDVVIRLELAQAPDPRTASTLRRLGAGVREQGLAFEVVVAGAPFAA